MVSWTHWTASAAALTLLACPPMDPVVDPEPDHEAEEQVAMTYQEAIQAHNQDDLEQATAAWAEDVRWVLATVEEPTVATSREEAIEAMRDARESLDLQLSAQRILVPHEDLMMVQGVAHGTHQGEFEGLEPTGRSFAVPYFHIVELSDGEITHVKALTHQMGLLAQVGAIDWAYPQLDTPERAQTIVGERDPDIEHLPEELMEAIRQRDEQALERLVTQDFVMTHHGHGARAEGIDEFLTFLHEHDEFALEDFDLEVTSVGDWVVAWGPVTGSFTGRIGELEVEDQQAQVFGAGVFRIEDGRIAESFHYSDPLEMVRQLEEGDAR